MRFDRCGVGAVHTPSPEDNFVDTSRTNWQPRTHDDNLVTGEFDLWTCESIELLHVEQSEGGSKLILIIAYRGICIFRLAMHSLRTRCNISG